MPPAVAAAIRAELPALAREIVETIQREVPGYARPLSGDFGRGIRTGTEIALRRFIGGADEDSPEVYRSLGYGEQRAGRSLDALQSAYRVGARVAWRQISVAAEQAGADAGTQSRLAEAMFAYIDQLASESVDGYTQAQLAQAGDRERRRATLLELLLSPAGEDAGALAAAARAAGWPLPRTLACLALDDEGLDAVARRLGGELLSGRAQRGACIVVPSPAGRLRRDAGAAAARLGVAIGVGPTVALDAAALSLRLAREAQALAAAGEAVAAERRLADIALRAAPDVVAVLHERSLAPLAGETEASRRRLAATLLAWLAEHGSQRAIAARLGVHPQTVRYRMQRLRDLFGPVLADPEARFELELALRAERLAGRL